VHRHLRREVGRAPDDLSEEQIIRPELLLWERGPLSIYYVPFERVNPGAKLFLVGLTPGRQQMWRASMAAARALREVSLYRAFSMLPR